MTPPMVYAYVNGMQAIYSLAMQAPSPDPAPLRLAIEAGGCRFSCSVFASQSSMCSDLSQEEDK